MVAWDAEGLDDASPDTLGPLFAVEPRVELLLIGAGAGFMRVPPPLKAALGERAIAVESMDTGAACRTYNVLMAEERRVAAALLPVRR